MIERPFFSYMGSKFARAFEYPVPIHDSIVEPFAGAAGYALRYPDRKISLYDTNPRIVGIWQYLIGANEREILALPDITAGQTVHDFDIPQEAKWLIGYAMSAGLSRPMIRPSRWLLDQHRPNGFWGAPMRERIARQLQFIRHWKVFEKPYHAAPNRLATWFIDPPYQKLDKTIYHSMPDFAHLGEWCKTRNGQTIVCEQHGADWLPFEPMAPTRTRHKRANGNHSGKATNREMVCVL